jgi:hypothetical protein
MFAWLVLAFATVALVAGSRRLRVPGGVAARLRRAQRLVPAAALLGVAAAGTVVAAGGEPERLEHAFTPARAIVDRVRAGTPPGATVAITGSTTETATDLQGAVAYALRSRGAGFVVSSLPGIGTRYDPARRAHDGVIEVVDPAPAAPAPGVNEIARVTLVDVPADAPAEQRGPRAVAVTLARAPGQR